MSNQMMRALEEIASAPDATSGGPRFVRIARAVIEDTRQAMCQVEEDFFGMARRDYFAIHADPAEVAQYAAAGGMSSPAARYAFADAMIETARLRS